MKSLSKNKTKELDWEKEFDKNWINPWNRNNFGIPKAHLDIKDFISKTLTQQRTELLEEILKAVDKLEKSNGDVPSPELRATVSYLLNKKDE